MKKSGLLNLVMFLVLLLSCPLLAQEKTDDPGYQVKQLASKSFNYQRYGPNDCGSEAEGYWSAKQLASESLISQRYGPAGCGSEAEGHDSRLSNSENYQYGRYGPLGYGTEAEGH
jgi:hypothetical protein